jgi:outer membrane protein TolC
MLGPGTLGSGQLDAGQKFEVSQSFPWPGKRRLRGEAAEFDAESIRGDLEGVREQLAYEARVAFVELWLADRAIEINGENAGLLAEFERVAEDRYGAGLVSKQDALQATVEREMLVHDGLVLKHVRNRAEARINALLDRDTDAALPGSPQELGPVIPPPPLRALQAAAATRRPELVETGARIQSAQRRADLARKEYYPDFSVMAGYDSFWQESELQPSIGFSINVPVQVSRRRAGVAEAKAEVSVAESRARAVYLDILREVDEAYEWVHEGLDAMTLYETRLIPAAEENLEAARSGYASGEVDFLALISAQKLLMDTRLRAQEGQAAYHTGLAKLARSIGSSVSGAVSAEE